MEELQSFLKINLPKTLRVERDSDGRGWSATHFESTKRLQISFHNLDREPIVSIRLSHRPPRGLWQSLYLFFNRSTLQRAVHIDTELIHTYPLKGRNKQVFSFNANTDRGLPIPYNPHAPKGTGLDAYLKELLGESLRRVEVRSKPRRFYAQEQRRLHEAEAAKLGAFIERLKGDFKAK